MNFADFLIGPGRTRKKSSQIVVVGGVLLLLTFVFCLQFNLSTALTTAPAPGARRCRPGDVPFGELCYRFVVSTDAITYESAADYCRQLGTNKTLAVIGSSSEQLFLANYLETRGWQDALIGLRLVKTNWRWSYGDFENSTNDESQTDDAVDDEQPTILLAQGCYGNAKIDAAKSMYSNSLTMDGCIKFCREKGKPFAGVQTATLCLCADQLPPLSDAANNCSLKCSGDPNQFCGHHRSAYYYSTFNFTRRPFSNWAISKPGLEGGCAASMVGFASSAWVDAPCATVMSFVCQFNRSAASFRSWPSNAVMSSSREKSFCTDAICYIFFPRITLDYSAASRFCSRRAPGGRLARIDTADVQVIVNRLITQPTSRQAVLPAKTSPPFRFWIGATNREFIWEDGAPLRSGFAFWASDVEPSLATQNNCVRMSGYEGAYMWRTRTCDTLDGSKTFICSGPSLSAEDEEKISGGVQLKKKSTRGMTSRQTVISTTVPSLPSSSNKTSVTRVTTAWRKLLSLQTLPVVARDARTTTTSSTTSTTTSTTSTTRTFTTANKEVTAGTPRRRTSASFQSSRARLHSTVIFRLSTAGPATTVALRTTRAQETAKLETATARTTTRALTTLSGAKFIRKLDETVIVVLNEGSTVELTTTLSPTTPTPKQTVARRRTEATFLEKETTYVPFFGENATTTDPVTATTIESDNFIQAKMMTTVRHHDPPETTTAELTTLVSNNLTTAALASGDGSTVVEETSTPKVTELSSLKQNESTSDLTSMSTSVIEESPSTATAATTRLQTAVDVTTTAVVETNASLPVSAIASEPTTSTHDETSMPTATGEVTTNNNQMTTKVIQSGETTIVNVKLEVTTANMTTISSTNNYNSTGPAFFIRLSTLNGSNASEVAMTTAGRGLSAGNTTRLALSTSTPKVRIPDKTRIIEVELTKGMSKGRIVLQVHSALQLGHHPKNSTTNSSTVVSSPLTLISNETMSGNASSGNSDDKKPTFRLAWWHILCIVVIGVVLISIFALICYCYCDSMRQCLTKRKRDRRVSPTPSAGTSQRMTPSHDSLQVVDKSPEEPDFSSLPCLSLRGLFFRGNNLLALASHHDNATSAMSACRKANLPDQQLCIDDITDSKDEASSRRPSASYRVWPTVRIAPGEAAAAQQEGLPPCPPPPPLPPPPPPPIALVKIDCQPMTTTVKDNKTMLVSEEPVQLAAKKSSELLSVITSETMIDSTRARKETAKSPHRVVDQQPVIEAPPSLVTIGGRSTTVVAEQRRSKDQGVDDITEQPTSTRASITPHPVQSSGQGADASTSETNNRKDANRTTTDDAVPECVRESLEILREQNTIDGFFMQVLDDESPGSNKENEQGDSSKHQQQQKIIVLATSTPSPLPRKEASTDVIVIERSSSGVGSSRVDQPSSSRQHEPPTPPPPLVIVPILTEPVTACSTSILSPTPACQQQSSTNGTATVVEYQNIRVEASASSSVGPLAGRAPGDDSPPQSATSSSRTKPTETNDASNNSKSNIRSPTPPPVPPPLPHPPSPTYRR